MTDDMAQDLDKQINALGQPVGLDLAGWAARPHPPRTPMQGQYCRIEPLALSHADGLFEAFQADTDGGMWTYMPAGPFADRAAFDAWFAPLPASGDPLFFAMLDRKTGKAVGIGSYLRIDPANGVVEVGYIAMSPQMQRTPISTEAMFLMMARVFNELGYRRYEWKCDALNAPSRRAAERFGFSYDGLFRNATIYKGRNRDTAWFSILDRDWPRIEAGFKAWLAPDNFDADGQQKQRLADLIAG